MNGSVSVPRLVEAYALKMDELARAPCVRFMAETGYVTPAKTVNTVKYVKCDSSIE
jgi:hypothetical protein